MPPTSSAASSAVADASAWGGNGGAGGSSSASISPSKSAAFAVAAASIASKSSGVLDFLQRSVSKPELLQLYTDETRGRFVCRAVLQSISPAAQQIVLRLSCTGGSFPFSGIQVWTKNYLAGSVTSSSKSSKKKEETAPEAAAATTHRLLQSELFQWAIISEVPTSNIENATVTLTPEFYQSLQESLCKLESSPWIAVTPMQIRQLEKEAAAAMSDPKMKNIEVKHAPEITVDDLERYTTAQWDAVLHFLVGTVGITKEPPPAVVHFLLETGLMQPDPEYTGRDLDDAPLVITQAGYEFMLIDNHQQVWHFVVQYLRSLETHQKKSKELRKEALLLLICLSFARVGEAYLLSSSFNKDGRVMVKHLTLFGLLYTRKIGKQTIFYPTRVAMQLVSSSTGNKSDDPDDRFSCATNAGGSAHWALSTKALEAALSNPTPNDSSHLAIIVQTNFQLCAYTTSELHVSMLGLFCDVQTIRRLPNVVFMVISRDSIKAAFNLGIEARQILRFLEKHAHPKLRQANPQIAGSNTDGAVPSNVIDQIWLWDRERKRVKFTEVYQHECLMQGEFQGVQQYAAEKGYLKWYSDDPSRQQLLIDYRYVDRVQNFARKWRARTAARHGEYD